MQSRVLIDMQMVLLIDSLRHTGCGDAFAQMKVAEQTITGLAVMTTVLLY